MFAATAGLGTWNADGALVHVQVSFEHAWQSIGLNLVAEGGLVFGGGLVAYTLTPGASLNLTSSARPPFVRVGFSMFRAENLGFHVGGGIKTTNVGSGLRVEGRIHIFPGGEESDFALEALFTYQVPF